MSPDRYADDEIRLADCRRRIVRHVQCRSCGYEPPRHAVPSCCPKCKGGCWESFVQMGKLRPTQVDGEASQACDGVVAPVAIRSETPVAAPAPLAAHVE